MHQIKKEVLERRSMNEYEKMQWHDYDKDTLEEVLEEGSKECITDNKEEEKEVKLSKRSNTDEEHTSQNCDEFQSQESNINSKKFVINENQQSSKSSSNQESSDQPELYFSCHERMVNGNYLDSELTVFKDKSMVEFSAAQDSRQTASMPEERKTNLVDQIDYDLDNYKINESSMFSFSMNQSSQDVPNKPFIRAEIQVEGKEDINPKFMNFLNDSQKILRPSIHFQNMVRNQSSSSCNKTSSLSIQSESSSSINKIRHSRQHSNKLSLKTENKPIKIESINARSRELTKVDKRKANVSDYEIKNPDELNLKLLNQIQYQKHEKVESLKINKPRF